MSTNGTRLTPAQGWVLALTSAASLMLPLDVQEDRDQEITMQQSLIRYRTKPGQADVNTELVRAVYAELHRTRPDGFRYATLKLDDQVTFLHIVQSEHDPSPILAVKAFGEFQAGIRDRCDQPPVQQTFTEVGSYRFFTG